MKKKILSLLVAILVFAMIMTACAAPAAGEPAVQEAAEEESVAEEVVVDEAADAGEAFLPSKPQIIAPKQDFVEVVDVIGEIDSENAANDYPQYDWTFAVHSYDPGYENSATIANSIMEECAKYGIKVIEAYANMDVSKYPSNYQSFILQDVDLIIDAAWLGNESIMDIAMEAEIPVVAFDVPLDTTRCWTVGGDPGVAGTTVGAYMADVVKDEWDGKVDYVVVSWSQALGEPMRIRMQSAIDAMVEAGLDIPEENIFWYDGGGETLKSKNIAADFLTAHPDATNILFAANTGNVAQGMLAATQTAGREDDVMIYSYGAEQVALDNFHGEENCWVADVGYYFRQYGWLATNTAIRVLNGEEVGYWVTPENFVINHQNVDEYQG